MLLSLLLQNLLLVSSCQLSTLYHAAVHSVPPTVWTTSIMILSLDCNLDKDLSKSEGDNQLVKHKDIGLYLQLYTY